MRLWIFSNHGYGFGEDVRDAALAWAGTRGIEALVALSARGVRPPAPRGLGDRIRAPVRRRRFEAWREDAARAIGVEPRILDDINAVEFLTELRPRDAGLVAGFNQIFHEDAIRRLDPFLNVHPSVLPLYRGPVPSRWCLANGETRSGFTFHRVAHAVDAGEVLHQESVDLTGCSTAEEVDRRISAVAARSTGALLDRILLGAGEFRTARLDAREVYRVHLPYGGPR